GDPRERGAAGPYTAGPGEPLAGPEIGVIESGAVVAVQGGVAVGRLQLPQLRATAGQPVGLAPRPPMLAGREEPLAALDARQAAGMASVAAFVPPAGPGRVLITSQNPDWPGRALDVPVLGPDVAAGFLVSRTGDPDRQAAWDLAGMLGGLPLALEQAAAYIQA